MTTQISKAFESGLEDGAEVVRDFDRLGREEPLSPEELAEEVESWFAPGKLGPDEGLINALGDSDLARALGLTDEQVEERGDAWSKALDDYNRGYRTGARREARADAE